MVRDTRPSSRSRRAGDTDRATTDLDRAANRKEHGATGHRLARSLDDPQALTVLVTFPDRAGAERFLADSSLRQAMSRAGVVSAPVVEFVEVTEEVPY